MVPTAGPGSTLRERKRERTRRALVNAAIDLFELHGYDGTTVADIAEAADIGTRTFFSYFASKEELLFPESDARVAAAVTAIANREPGDRPADVLLRALRDVGSTGEERDDEERDDEERDDMVDRVAAARVALFRTVPAVRGRALQIQLDAQREIAGHLQRAFPDELDAVSAAALVGAFIGAVSGALQVLLDDPDAPADPDSLRRQLRQATDLALRPWQSRSSPSPRAGGCSPPPPPGSGARRPEED
jgi:AcrR family transcriptional regulator